MSGQLHQFHVSYQPEQDRLLLRIKTTDLSEFRLWLTRRFVKRAWPELIKLLARAPSVAQQRSSEAQAAVLAFEHEQTVGSANFSQRYTRATTHLPLGATPVLVSRLTIKPGPDGSHLVCFHPKQGQGLDVRVTQDILHSLCKLIADAVGSVDWDLSLEISRPVKYPAAPRQDLN